MIEEGSERSGNKIHFIVERAVVERVRWRRKYGRSVTSVGGVIKRNGWLRDVGRVVDVKTRSSHMIENGIERLMIKTYFIVKRVVVERVRCWRRRKYGRNVTSVGGVVKRNG